MTAVVARRLAPVLLVAAALAAPASALAGPSLRPLGKLDCNPSGAARFCAGSVPVTAADVAGPTDKRVRSTLDTGAIPLDANVALPATGSGPFPLIVLMHSWGGKKTGAAEMVRWAGQGYAVLSASARGWWGSCGLASVRVADPVGCARGWTHLADARYEVRDVQHLIGLLADEGIADPARVGVTGASYGGGLSTMLATLNDRQMLPDGSLIRWRSPAGRALRIAAAAPIVPWTDFAYALMPNGHALDYAVTPRASLLDPPGVLKLSNIVKFYATGAGRAYYAAKGVDPTADLTGWLATFQQGEPYASAGPGSVGEQLSRFHSAYGLLDRGGRRPAPILVSNGTTDDFFPVDEAVRFGNRLRDRFGAAVFAQLHFDWGHPRGQGKPADTSRLAARHRAWFAYYLKGQGPRPFGGVELLTQTCPKGMASGGPFRAATWPALHPGEVRLRSGATRTLRSDAGDPAVNRAFDPVRGPGACATTPARDLAGTATYRFTRVRQPFTLMGSPTIIATLAIQGANPQVAVRLLDVGPDGSQTLVARALYRPDRTSRSQVFQLHPNGWRFGTGHIIKLELLGNDATYGRKSNGSFTIGVSALGLRLPVHERPGAAGGVVKRPAPVILPPA